MYYVNHKRRADTPKEVSNKFQLKVKNNGGVTSTEKSEGLKIHADYYLQMACVEKNVHTYS